MVDLNTLIPADSPLYLLFAYQINGAGDIVGEAVTENGECTAELHAFVATVAAPRVTATPRMKAWNQTS